MTGPSSTLIAALEISMPANPQVTDEMVEKAAIAVRQARNGSITPPENGTNYDECLARTALEAALADHVVVPREPTEAMIFAMHHQIDWCRDDQNTYALEHTSQTDNGIGTTCKQDILDAYRAMISAAPLPQKEG